MSDVLEVDSVILRFDNLVVLNDVYLKSETGKITGLLGRNGSGKTSLMKIIYGTLLPQDRSVRINGNAIYEDFANPKLVRYLPQGEFIPKSLSLKRIFNDFDLNFDDFTGLFPEFEKYYHTALKNLSGGEQRIVEIYSIVVSKTKFSMLDEPFSQVMPVYAEKIKNLIVREKQNKGIIVTDHLYRYLVDICDVIYVINNAKTYRAENTSDLKKFGYIN